MNLMIPVMIVMIIYCYVMVYISEDLEMVGIFSLALPNVTIGRVLLTTRFPW